MTRVAHGLWDTGGTVSTQFAQVTSDSARNERPIVIEGFADAAWAKVLRSAFFVRCAAERVCLHILAQTRCYEQSLD